MRLRILKLTMAALMACSFYGLLTLLSAFSGGLVTETDQLAVGVAAGAFFALAEIGAVLGYRGSWVGIGICEAVLILQLLWIDTPLLSYHAMVGPYLFLPSFGTSSIPFAGVGASFSIRSRSAPSDSGWAINLAAVILLVAFDFARRRTRTKTARDVPDRN